MTNIETLELLLEEYENDGDDILPQMRERSPVVQAVGAMPYITDRCGGPVQPWDLVIDAAMEAFEPGTDDPDFKAIRAFFNSSSGLAANSVHAEGMHANWLRFQEWQKRAS